MRKTLKALLTGMAFIALTLASCMDPNSMANGTAGIDDNDDDTTLKDNDGKSDKDIVLGAGSFGDDFIRGFDASAVDYYETLSANKISEWKDTDGTAREFFHILKRHGYDTVRLRIWNDPSNVVDPNDTPPTGDNTLERTVSMAKRIKAAGLKLMLDFHYSDTWADPAKQFVPKEWQDLDSEDKVAEAVSSYTTEVLEALYKDAGVVPAYVQIGNEINNGLLLHTGTTDSKTGFKYAAGNTSDTVKKYLSAASKAVRDFDKDIKIIIHVASSNSPTRLLDTLESANLDYDIIGLSYYPWESSHGTISAMKDKIKEWKDKYGKHVMIAECSAQVDGANSGANSNVSKRIYSYTNMKDPATGILYSDITEDEDNPGAVKGSVENAKAILRHIMQETYNAHGIGCVAWGGEMRGDWDRAMFSWSGEAWDNIDAFNYSPADGYPYEDGDDGDDDDSGTGEIVTKLISSETVTLGTQGTFQKVLEYDDIKDYETVYITLANISDWGTGSWKNCSLSCDGSNYTVTMEWQESGSFTDPNVVDTSKNGGHFTSITPSDYPDGVWIVGPTALSGTLFVTGVVGDDDSGTGGGTDDDDEPSVGEVITKLENDTASAKIAIGKEGTYQLVVEYNAIKDYDKVYITLANITSEGTGTWNDVCLGDPAWKYTLTEQTVGNFIDTNVVSSTKGYFASISPSTYQNGVYITGKTGIAGTLYVTGVKVSTEGTTYIKTETGSCTVGGNWDSYAEAISASKFGGLNVTKLEITVTLSPPLSEGKIGVGGSTNNKWLANLDWSTPSGSVFTVTLSEENEISIITTNGLGLAGDASGTANVSCVITYYTTE